MGILIVGYPSRISSVTPTNHPKHVPFCSFLCSLKENSVFADFRVILDISLSPSHVLTAFSEGLCTLSVSCSFHLAQWQFLHVGAGGCLSPPPGHLYVISLEQPDWSDISLQLFSTLLRIKKDQVLTMFPRLLHLPHRHSYSSRGSVALDTCVLHMPGMPACKSCISFSLRPEASFHTPIHSFLALFPGLGVKFTVFKKPSEICLCITVPHPTLGFCFIFFET